MKELREAIKRVAGVGCVGSFMVDHYDCPDHCPLFDDCQVITDALAKLDAADDDAGKVLEGLAELEDDADKRSLIVSYGIVCEMKGKAVT